MLNRNKQTSCQINLLSSTIPYTIILKILPVFFTSFCITGCYTMLTPPPEYFVLEENQFDSEVADSVIVTNQNINNYYCSRCGIFENSCSSIHWRYNYWTGKYYCDPFYYNYSYYNHHYNDNYLWHSYHNWDYYNYSPNYANNSYTPSKKSKRGRSFDRLPDNPVPETSIQENTDSTPLQSDSYFPEDDNSSAGTTINSSPTITNQPSTSDTKPRRKHNRRPL